MEFSPKLPQTCGASSSKSKHELECAFDGRAAYRLAIAREHLALGYQLKTSRSSRIRPARPSGAGFDGSLAKTHARPGTALASPNAEPDCPDRLLSRTTIGPSDAANGNRNVRA
jgi:hypothetical protein